MTSFKKTLSLFLLCGVILLSSCKDDEATSSGLVSKDEAKGVINAFNGTATDDLQDLADVEGMEAIQDLFDLTASDDPFGRMQGDKQKVKAFFQKHGREFRSIVSNPAARTTGTEPFDFASYVGVYSWNPALGEAGEFELTDEADIIVIEFPTEGSETNNARLELLAYDEVEVYNEELEQNEYLPTVLEADLYVGDAKKAALALEAEWDESGFPLDAAIDFAVAPYSLQIAFDVSAATSSTVSAFLKLNNEVLLATSVKVNYSDNSKSEESLKNLEGFVQFRNLKIQGTINAEAANGTEVNWNDIVKLGLYSENNKLADIVFVEDDQEGVIPYLQYADGTKEKLETAMQPVMDEIESLTAGWGSNS